MRNPIDLIRDRALLTAVVMLIQEIKKHGSTDPMSYRALKCILSSVKDKEITELLHDTVFLTGKGAPVILDNQGKKYFCAQVPMEEALTSEDKHLACEAAATFVADCEKIRHEIARKYGF